MRQSHVTDTMVQLEALTPPHLHCYSVSEWSRLTD